MPSFGGNLTFDKVELTGGGFEFDNLVVSTTAQTPDPRLVLARQFDSSQSAVRFEPNGASVEGTMPNQVGTTPATLTSNTHTRSGFTFAGWATEEDGGVTRFADGVSYNFSADLTLYARWTATSVPGSREATSPAVAAQPSLAATGSNSAGWVCALGGGDVRWARARGPVSSSSPNLDRLRAIGTRGTLAGTFARLWVQHPFEPHCVFVQELSPYRTIVRLGGTPSEYIYPADEPVVWFT